MILRSKISPNILEGTGTTKSAKERASEYMANKLLCFSYGTTGNCYKDHEGNCYPYSIEVAKRGKHKGHPKYKVCIYKISKNWLLENWLEVVQHHRNFTIQPVPKKRH